MRVTQASQLALGKVIKGMREKAGISQRTLAARAELSQSWISAIETGKVDARWGDLRRVARGIDLELPALLGLAESLEKREGSRREGRPGR